MLSPLLLSSSSPAVLPPFLSFFPWCLPFCPAVHWSASMACPTTLSAAAHLLQPASSPQFPGCTSHLAGIHGKRGGSPSHSQRITKLLSNSPKALLNILQQVSPPHCISNPLPDSLTIQPGSGIWLIKSPPLGNTSYTKCMKPSPKMGVYRFTNTHGIA